MLSGEVQELLDPMISNVGEMSPPELLVKCDISYVTCLKKEWFDHKRDL